MSVWERLLKSVGQTVPSIDEESKVKTGH
jgi:hypothetical protein